jgi:DNA-binding transcriptional regulator YiaG
MLLGWQIKAARQRLGENQTEFAARFGVDQSTIARWERRGVDRGPAKVAMETLFSSLQTHSEPSPHPAQA